MKTLVLLIMAAGCIASANDTAFICKADNHPTFFTIDNLKKEWNCGGKGELLEFTLSTTNSVLFMGSQVRLEDCTFTDKELVDVSHSPNNPAFETIALFKKTDGLWNGHRVNVGAVTCTEYKKAE